MGQHGGMPDATRVLCFRAGDAPGAPRPVDLSGSNLDEMWQRLPTGAYTTLRTWDGRRLIRLEAHVVRLEQSARYAGAGRTIDRVAIRSALAELLPLSGVAGEARVRLLLTYGAGTGEVYAGTEPLLTPDPGKYDEGVATVTCSLARPNPRSKSSAFIGPSRQARAALRPGSEEAVMTGLSGELLEGLTSNFFGVQRGGIWTADEGILVGITRTIVLEQARAAGVPVHLEPVRADDVATLDEAFITSSTRGVMPVVAVDGTTVGCGAPGPVTRMLRERYERQAAAEAEAPT
jgi:branched-chain amino acid aminotransferase